MVEYGKQTDPSVDVVAHNETAAGEPHTAMVEVENTGVVGGGERLVLRVDGEVVDETFVRVGAGEETQVEFPFRLSEPGDHDVEVEAPDGDVSFSTPVTVTEQSAEFRTFSYEGFEVPEKVPVDSEVEVPVTVTNTGDEQSLQVVKLTVEDDVVRATGVDLQPGASVDLTFRYAFDARGSYEVAVEDLDPQSVTATVW